MRILKRERKVKKIAISGGKGGTGKSTVSVLMAGDLLREGKKVILCDCDVECPNDYLLLGEKLGKPVGRVTAEFPELNREKCEKCELCVRTCRQNAIFQKPGQYPVFIKDLCSGCGACWMVCPYKAIKPKKEETGKIYLNKIKNQKSKIKNTKQKSENFYLVTGMANPGLEETGPVVTGVKKFALDLAERVKADVILFDTAAGTHCPVISALLNCDFAYAVTEPTPMGAMDLGLILDLSRKLKVPMKIILNQADLGDKKRIEKVAKRFKVEIDKEIPYSKKLVESYSKGQLFKFKM